MERQPSNDAANDVTDKIERYYPVFLIETGMKDFVSTKIMFYDMIAGCFEQVTFSDTWTQELVMEYLYSMRAEQQTLLRGAILALIS